MNKIASFASPLHTISALASVEIRSAIRRKESGREITSASAALAIKRLGFELDLYTIVDISPGVLSRAKQVIDTHKLRALDAIQLATAILDAKTNPNSSLTFVCSDHRLLQAAQSEGLHTLDPTASTSIS